MTTGTHSFDVEREALFVAGRELGVGLGAVVFLAGQVRASRFSESIGVERLELPVAPGRSLLHVWSGQLAELRNGIGGDWTVRVQMHQGSRLPSAAFQKACGVQVTCDPVAYRGTAGVLGDVTSDLSDEQYLLVVAGPCVPVQPVDRVVGAMAQQKADVVLVDQPEGVPCGLMLVRRAMLADVPKLGFWDFKERWLPRLQSRKAEIRVVDFEEPVTLPVRTLSEYLQVLRLGAVKPEERQGRQGPFAENLTGRFRLVDETAQVGEGARLIDSVVLPGARVGADALVVRSVVGAGAQVKARDQVVDRVVAAPRKREPAA